MIVRLFFVALSLLVCISSADAKLFDAKETFLSNGMQVVVIENHKAPIIKHMVWYKSGSTSDMPGKGGTAHLLEHLMFRGTNMVKNSEYNMIVNENGASTNAFTSYDFTAYHQMADISKLELLMFLEADRMQNLKLTKESFEKERDIVLNERQQVIENNPLRSFGETMRKHLWLSHPYGREVIGSRQEILGLKLKDVENFYQQHYAPNNAILVLSGDIEPNMAFALAEKYYGKASFKKNPQPVVFAELNNSVSSKVEVSIPSIGADRYVRNYVLEHRDYAMSVLAQYLGGDDTSELYKSLVLGKKNAIALFVSYDFSSKDLSTFSISALPSGNGFEVELDKAIEEAMSRLTKEKLEKVKQKMLVDLVYLKDNPEDAAHIAGQMLASGMSLSELENYEYNVRKVSVDDVLKAANVVFKKSAKQVGVLTK